ncbi:hypothetical protein FRC12_018030 [Ceratobasidium sp. 428]|nr:hypothetical protein FRC12_018030 [Ceratobasidium sp. 428]
MASAESSNQPYDGFEADYSEAGILSTTISLEAVPPGVKPPPTNGRKGKLNGGPKKVTIPLWFALKVVDEKETPLTDEHFVGCRFQDSDEVFLLQKDFEARLPKQDGSHWKVYEEDWNQEDDALACDGYDDDGIKLGTSGAPSWPTNGFKAELPSKPSSTPSKNLELRYRNQAKIWFEIATKYVTAGSSRLWKPSAWPYEKPIKLYFFPVGAWPSRSDLSKVVEDLKKDAEEKAASKSSRRLSLTTWLDWEAPTDESKTSEGLVKISRNLLNHYETFISKDDLKILLKEQTQGAADWRRDWPDHRQEAEAAQRKIEKGSTPAYSRFSEPVARRKLVASLIPQSKGADNRVDASKIMGGQSADMLAHDWWHPKDGPKVIAEAFGTFEANSDMSRAELLIRKLRNQSGAKGYLTTRMITADLVGWTRQLSFINPETANEEAWPIPEWVDAEKYPWLAPGLYYKGNMTLPEHELPVVWSTRINTFSRYYPTILEGSIDVILFNKYFEDHPGTAASSPEKIDKAGPSTKPAESSTNINVLVAASPSLAFLGPPERPPPPTSRFTPTRRVSSSSKTPVGLVQRNTNDPRTVMTRQPGPSVGAGHSGMRQVVLTPEELPGSSRHRITTVTPHPRAQAAWQAVRKNADSVKLGDVQINYPHLVTNGDPSELPLAPPATGFLVEGTLKIFGLDRDVKLQSWHGPTPPNVQLDSEPPVYQRVQLESLDPLEIISQLSDTSFPQFEFQNVVITYQNYQFVKTLPIGWSITADIPIDKKHHGIYDILHSIMNIPEEGLQLQALASLGIGHSWNSRVNVADFVVRGLLRVQSSNLKDKDIPGIRLHDDVILTRIGLLVYGVGNSTLGIFSDRYMDCGFKIFGDMHIKVPGSVTPLELDFEIGEFGGVAELTASVKGDVWKNVFGTGINLDMVQLSASFDWSHALEVLDFDVQAHLRAGSASALVSGKYTAGGDYSLSAHIQDFGCDGVVDLFRHYTGEELSLPTHVDITIGSATIEIAKGKGLSITVDKLEFEGHSSTDVTIELTSKGVTVEGKTGRIKLSDDPGVSLVSAYMKVSFEKEDSGKSTDVALGGQVELAGFQAPSISAGVHLYKDSSTNKLEWTVYGTFTELGNTTTLGKLFPKAKTAFFADFALQNLMFIAASKDDPTLSSLNPNKYPIKKGVQFSACFDQVGPLNKLLRRDSFPGLTLSASWQTGASFLLDVVLPTNTMIHIGHGITTDPITLSINLEQILIQIGAGIKVPVPKSTTPLDFEASLTIEREDVTLAGEMIGVWDDPFGISKSVSIGPSLELGLSINLVTFPLTGLPSGFSFRGGLSVGKSEGDVAVDINEDPSQELLKGKIEKFGIQDLVSFARELTELDIPMPPDFINFDEIRLYMSSGVTLGSVTYPAGFSFKANLKLFGVQLDASAEVTGGTLKATGSVGEIHAGPLYISGQHGKDAMLSLQIGSSVQQLHVDGAISLLGLNLGITLQLEILPKPEFSFDFTLRFTDLLTFVVDAKMTGEITNLKDLHSNQFGFALHAVFEQHLLDYVREQVHKLLMAAKKKADAAIENAENSVKAEEAKLQSGIQSAQKKLDADYNSWLAHSQKVHADSQRFINGYMKKLHSLQGDVETERKQYNAKLKDAEGAVQHANADRAAKMRDAEAAVTKAKKDWDDDVSKAEKDLEAAKKTFQQKFGSAEEDIDNARRKVDSIQTEIDSVQNRINYCEDASWWHFDLKAEIVYQEGKKVALEGYKLTADGVLTVARDIVAGTEYLGAKAAIPAAEAVVAAAGHTGDGAFNAAQATLHGVDEATARVLDVAQSTLKEIQKGGDALIKGAESALSVFIAAQKDLLYAAQHAIDDLIHSAEWLAYQTASAALDVAHHATHALDVAEVALKVAKTVTDGTITVADDVITKVLEAFDITEIVLKADLGALSGGGDDQFDVAIKGKILGKDFNLNVKLDIKDTVKFIKDIFDELMKELKKL